MEIEIQRIIIKKRVRKNLGDLSHLMNSLRHHGLLNPVIISENNELIAGHRRLEAAKRLGWKKIEVRTLSHTNKAEKLELELDENLYRKDFTEEELAEGFTRLDQLKNPTLLQKIINSIITFFRRIFKRK